MFLREEYIFVVVKKDVMTLALFVNIPAPICGLNCYASQEGVPNLGSVVLNKNSFLLLKY